MGHSIILSITFMSIFFLGNAFIVEDFDVDQPCENYIKDADPTLCHRIQVYEDREKEYSILNAIGILKLKNRIFPLMNEFWAALVVFDEPLYPIPLGPSVYFFFCNLHSNLNIFFIKKCLTITS